MKGNNRLIDIHAHIVFGVDDGARNPDESLKLIDMAVSQGIEKIITLRNRNGMDLKKL